MNVDYINPFIEASQDVLKQMTGIEAGLGKVYLKESPYKSDNVMILVGLTGDIRGHVTFVMSYELSLFVASSMMGGVDLKVLDELSKSAIGELTNMILGNAATLLFNKGFSIEITPPSFLVGDNIEVSSAKMKTICIPLKIADSGILNIDISLEEK